MTRSIAYVRLLRTHCFWDGIQTDYRNKDHWPGKAAMDRATLFSSYEFMMNFACRNPDRKTLGLGIVSINRDEWSWTSLVTASTSRERWNVHPWIEVREAWTPIKTQPNLPDRLTFRVPFLTAFNVSLGGFCTRWHAYVYWSDQVVLAVCFPPWLRSGSCWIINAVVATTRHACQPVVIRSATKHQNP